MSPAIASQRRTGYGILAFNLSAEVPRYRLRESGRIRKNGRLNQPLELERVSHYCWCTTCNTLICSALLDLGATEGLVNIGQGYVPIHLVEQLVHVAGLSCQKCTLAIGY